ncbi:hypothetical protein [Shewanella sp. KX20019]|nr:hypothetical protein [Shewanella sp. KX20019]
MAAGTKAINPKRGPIGIRNCDAIAEVMLNPDKQPGTDVRNVA